MNQIFSAPRFGAYFKKSFFEQWRSMLLQFVILTGVLSIVIATNGNRLYFHINMTIFFIFSTIKACRFSDYFKTRPRKIEFLLTPASQFEKFASFAVYSFAAVPIMYAMSVFCAQYAAMLLTAVYKLSAPEWSVPFSIVEMRVAALKVFFISFFGNVSYYILGATIWPRNSFLKSTAVSFAIGLVLMLVMIAGVSSTAFRQIVVMNTINFSEPAAWWNVLCTISVVLSVVYLAIAYVRVTEFEVNETKY